MFASHMRGGVLTACDPDEQTAHTHEWSEGYSYDEEYHYKTCSGCEEHTGTEAHVYDGDDDATCNVCDYVRHVHPLVWKYDGENHWQEYSCEHHADEQLNKGRHVWDDDGKCKDCKVDKSTFHTHNYEWKYDEKQHWEMTTCTEHAPEMSSNGKSDHEFSAGVCECGLEEIYINVYNLYKSNCEYKGESNVDDFATWYASLKEQNVDHVGFNAMGDAVFYASEDDTTGVVKYYAQRTYTVKVVAGTPASGVESVYLTVKATVNGQEQTINGKTALDVKATGADGSAQLTFTPVWGYTSNSVSYKITIADKTNDNPFVMPNNYIYDGDGEELAVGADVSSDEGPVTMTLIKCLGLGQSGAMENVNVAGYEFANTHAYRVRLLPGLAEGWYQLDYVTTIQGKISGASRLFVEGSEAIEYSDPGIEPNVVKEGGESTGGGSAIFLFYLTSDCTELVYDNPIAAHVATLTLTKLSEELDFAQPPVLKVNDQDDTYKLVYTLKNVKAGRYVVTSGGPYVSVKFDDSEELHNISNFSILTLTGEEKTAEFVSTDAVARPSVSSLSIMPLLDLKEEGGSLVAELEMDDKNQFAYYLWQPTESMHYNFAIIADEPIGTIFVALEGNYFLTHSSGSTKSVESYSLNTVEDHIVVIQNASKQVANFKLLISKVVDESIAPNSEFTLEFDTLNTMKYLSGSFEPGIYLATVQAETIEQTYMLYAEDGHYKSTVFNVKASVGGYLSTLFQISDEYVGADGKVSVKFTAQYDLSIPDGEKISYRINLQLISEDRIKKAQSVEQFEATFDESNVSVFELDPENDGFVSLKYSSSDSDLKYLKATYISIDQEGGILFGTHFDVVKNEVNERSYLTPSAIKGGTRYIVLLTYENSEAKPGNITVDVKKGFADPEIEVYGTESDVNTMLRVGVGFSAVKNATQYTLYEAVTTSTAAPAIGDPAYKAVKTYTNEDAETNKYAITDGLGNTFNYTNNSVAESGYYFYYYVVVSGSEEYEPLTTSVVMCMSYSNKARRTYNINLTVPEELVGKTVYIRLRNQEATTLRTYVYGYDIVELKSTTQKIVILSELASVAIDILGTRDWNTVPYHFPTNVEVDNANEIALSIVENAIVTVNVKFPENFVFDVSDMIYVQLFRDTSSVSSTSISAKKDVPLTDQSVTLYVSSFDPSYEYYVGVSLTTFGKLPEGFVLPAKVKVNISEDRLTGSAEIEFADRCEVGLTIKLPAYFTGGEATVYAYVQNEDGTLAQDPSISKQITLEGGQESATTKTVSMYVPIGHKYTLKMSLFSGYTAADVADIDAVTAKTLSATFNVEGNIEIAATVNIPDGVALTSQIVYLYVVENGKYTQLDSQTLTVAADGERSQIVTFHAPLGLKDKQFVVGGSDAVRTNVSKDRNYCWNEYGEVNIHDDGDGPVGTAEFAFEMSYVITLDVTKDYVPSGSNDIIYIVKNGEAIYNGTFSFIKRQPETYTITLYLPVALYDENATYLTFANVNKTDKKTWFCPPVEFKFDTDTRSVHVDMGFTKTKDNVKVTVKFPEGFVIGYSSYTLKCYQPGIQLDGKTQETMYMSKTIAYTAITSGMKDNAYTFDYNEYAWNAETYYVLTNISTLGYMSDTTGIKQYYCEPAHAVWDEEVEAYVATLEIKETPQVKVTVEAPEELTSAENATVSVGQIKLYDKTGKLINTLSASSQIKLGEASEIFAYTTIVDADIISGMYATADPTIYLNGSSAKDYYATVEIVPNGSTFSIEVNILKKEYTFQINYKDVPSGLNKSTTVYFYFYVYEKGEDGALTQIEQLDATLLSGRTEYTATVYSRAWDPEKYVAKLEIDSRYSYQVSGYTYTINVYQTEEDKAAGNNVWQVDVSITAK